MRLLRGRETDSEKNEKRAGGAVQPLRNRFTFAQALAEDRREPRENETPNRSGGDKAEPEHDEGRDFHVRCGIDELREKREKEERDFRIENVRENSLTKRGHCRATAKV